MSQEDFNSAIRKKNFLVEQWCSCSWTHLPFQPGLTSFCVASEFLLFDPQVYNRRNWQPGVLVSDDMMPISTSAHQKHPLLLIHVSKTAMWGPSVFRTQLKLMSRSWCW